MKKFPFLIIGLFMSVLISLCLSYVLLFNSDILFALFSADNQVSSNNSAVVQTTNINTKEVKPKRQLKEVMSPTVLVIGQNNQHYFVNDVSVYKDMMTLMEANPYEMSEVKINQDEIKYQQIINSNRVELVYSDLLPLSLQSHFIRLTDDGANAKDFEFNRIIFELNNNDSFYLVNSKEQTFVQVPLHQDQTTQFFTHLTLLNPNTELRAERVQLVEDYTYLPSKRTQVKNQVYTLTERPESTYVGDFFGTGGYTISEGGTADERKYQSVQNEIVMNNQAKYYYAEMANEASLITNTKAGTISKAFSTMNYYDNWSQELRIEDTGKRIRFRRYLEGLPVISLERFDYGATSVRISSRNITFTGSMLNIFSHVADQSQVRQLPSVDELIYILNEQNYNTQQFTAIYMAYVWQPDMQNYQLAIFEPTWVFRIKDKVYTLEQVANGLIESDPQAGIPIIPSRASIGTVEMRGDHNGL